MNVVPPLVHQPLKPCLRISHTTQHHDVIVYRYASYYAYVIICHLIYSRLCFANIMHYHRSSNDCHLCRSLQLPLIHHIYIISSAAYGMMQKSFIGGSIFHCHLNQRAHARFVFHFCYSEYSSPILISSPFHSFHSHIEYCIMHMHSTSCESIP